MKKSILLSYLLSMLLMFPAEVFGAADEGAVTMTSYEQGPIDYNGALALTNNAGEVVENVYFQLVYKDMNGNPMDYQKFYREVRIEPGMTRKIEIPAYEYERDYVYYKTDEYTSGTRFQVDFELLGYNVDSGSVDEDTDCGSFMEISDPSSTAGWILLVVVLFVSGVIGLYALVGALASSRHRSVVGWILLSMFLTPLLVVAILLCLGDSRPEE